MKKKIIFIVAMAAALCMLGGCSQTTAKDVQETAEDVAKEVADQVENIADSEEEHVLSVKNGHLEQYPENPIGEAFDSFFGSPTWKYFKGTDTGDNEESINDTEHNVDVVEFTGYCTYQDVEVKARLQFILNEDGTFTTGALSFNDVPQSQLITAAMMEKIFEQDITKAPENTISVYDAAGRYESDSLSLSVSIYSEETEDNSVGIMEWTDHSTGETGETILYKNTDFIAVFEWEGISYYMSFTENGAAWCDLLNTPVMQFEKTESYQS